MVSFIVIIFIIPAIYAYINKLYFYFILLSLTSIISINYWRKATYSWRRNIDLVFAKISFFIFIYNGILYVKTIYYLVPAYSGLIILLYCYYLSKKQLELKKNNWYKYHFIFHFIIMYEQIIIINCIIKNKYLK